nr:MAG TPA: hypothetical protein [Caudoviricetes sp.]
MKLTKETAKKVIRQVLPHCGKVETLVPGERYMCDCGMLTIYCDSDVFDGNGKIHVRIKVYATEGSITLFFDPETLERDCAEENKWRGYI